MIDLLNSSLRLATPLIFASMGGLICEKAGIATICLEGIILVSAFTSAVADFYFHSPVLSVLLGVLSGGAFMLFHAGLTIKSRADQIVSGVAVNLLASGLTPLLTKALFQNSTNTPSLPGALRLSVWSIPFLSRIPLVGSLFEHLSLVFLALILPFLISLLVYKTRFGLRLSSAGDGPEALRTAGVSVERIRVQALLLGGWITSVAGVYLAIGQSSQFTRDMSAGRGFIALAALIFGNWRPIPVFLACLFFGFTESLEIYLQSSEFFSNALPVQFIQSLPYLITLVLLVASGSKSQPPLAIANKED